MALPWGSRAEPAPRRKLVSDAVLGMLLFVFTEVMLFSGMISAHTIVKSRSAGQMWPPFGQPRLPVEATAVNTAALLASGLALVLAHFAYRKQPRRALAPMAAAVILGAFFVAFQGREWVALLGEGLTLTSSTYGAFFYLIVGTHGLHALAAIGALGWAWWRLRGERLTGAQLAAVEIFWYFVVLVWPVLYFRVYL
ncbi:MAG: cytochrome c oxidase subunit 3 [Longimicrobiales bacterium]